MRTTLPSYLRTKLPEENIEDYSLAVERAQQPQDININEHHLNTISQQPPDQITQKLDEIVKKKKILFHLQLHLKSLHMNLTEKFNTKKVQISFSQKNRTCFLKQNVIIIDPNNTETVI